MILNPHDEQLVLDYVIYMMMGSFFDKTKAASIWMEKTLRLRYLLLGSRTQYEIEEDCENYFEAEILPALPEDFLQGTATVHWTQSKDEKYTAVVFARGKRQLWIASLYGGRYKRPSFEHWAVGFELKDVPGKTHEREPVPKRRRKAG